MAEVPSATAAVHAAWKNWRIPRQLGGRILLPRAVASKLIALSSCFVRKSLAPSYKRKSLEDAGFEPILAVSRQASALVLVVVETPSSWSPYC